MPWPGGERAAGPDEAAWTRALELDPRDPDATANLGLLRWRAGEITDDELLRRLAAVLQANRGLAAAEVRTHYLTGLVHLERGDLAAAVTHLLEAAERAPDDPDIAAALALADGAEAPDPVKLRCESGWIWSVAVTADGTHVLWGAEDGVLRLWTPGKKPRKFTGHTGGVRGVDMTPDGRFGLSAADDGTIRYWALTSGGCVRTLAGHTRSVRSVQFTPDGTLALSAATDGQIILWDLRTGRQLGRAAGDLAIYSAALMPDGWHALSGENHGVMRYWDLRTGECLRTFTGHTGQCLHGRPGTRRTPCRVRERRR